MTYAFHPGHLLLGIDVFLQSLLDSLSRGLRLRIPPDFHDHVVKVFVEVFAPGLEVEETSSMVDAYLAFVDRSSLQVPKKLD